MNSKSIQVSSFISLDNLHFHAFHGVLPQERLVGNDYDVSIKVEYNITKAAESDNIAYALNYAELYALVKKEMSQPSNLIENVAWRIGNKVLSSFENTDSISISLTKINPPVGGECSKASVQLNMKK